MGAEGDPPQQVTYGPSLGHENDQLIQKANQNAIENYKRFIASVKHIRASTLDKDSTIIPTVAQSQSEEIKMEPLQKVYETPAEKARKAALARKVDYLK